MSRKEADFLEPYVVAGASGRHEIALEMLIKFDPNLERLLWLPDNIFTKREDLEGKEIRINEIIFSLYVWRKEYAQHNKCNPGYFAELVKRLITVDRFLAATGRSLPQIDFSYICPTSNKDLLSRAVSNGDLEVQEIVIGDRFDSEVILKLYEKYKSRALPLIKILVEKDKKKSALTGAELKIDLNFADARGSNILLLAVFENDIEALRFLVSEGVNLDYQHPVNKGVALINAISQGKKGVAEFLIDNGANLAVTNVDLETPLMLALIHGQEELALKIAKEMGGINLQKSITGDDTLCYAELYSREKFLAAYLNGDRKEYSTAVNAKKLLDLMYSQDGFPGLVGQNIEMQRRFFKRHPLGASGQDNPYLAIAEEIDRCIDPSSNGKYRIDLGDGKTLEVVKMPIPCHVAFIVVEYHKNDAGNDVAVKLSYCDGNLPLSTVGTERYRAGEVCFQVDQEWAGEADLGKKIAEFFLKNIAHALDELGRASADGIKGLFADFVEIDESGYPKITEENIATVAQDRGNCSIKSLNILLRAIRKKTNPTLKFEERNEHGNLLRPAGDGYEEFKTYKKFIIEHCLKDILEIAKGGGINPDGSVKDRISPDNSVYSVVLDSLKSSFLQSASKKDSNWLERSMMVEIADVLTNYGIEISEVKSSKGHNAHYIAAAQKIVRAASWCAKRGIELVHIPGKKSPFLSFFDESRKEILKSYQRLYQGKQLEPNFATNLMFAAAQRGNNSGEEFALTMISNGFSLDTQNSQGVSFLDYSIDHSPRFVNSLLKKDIIKFDDEFLKKTIARMIPQVEKSFWNCKYLIETCFFKLEAMEAIVIETMEMKDDVLEDKLEKSIRSLVEDVAPALISESLKSRANVLVHEIYEKCLDQRRQKSQAAAPLVAPALSGAARVLGSIAEEEANRPPSR